MTTIKFSVPINPVGKARPRFSMACGHPVAYTPAKTKLAENTIKLYARREMGDRYPFERGIAVKVKIKAYFPIPKSYTKEHRLRCLSGAECHTKRPDCDNIEKLVLDALNNCVFWDDSQVVSIECEKTYTGNDGHIEIEVSTLNDEQ